MHQRVLDLVLPALDHFAAPLCEYSVERHAPTCGTGIIERTPDRCRQKNSGSSCGGCHERAGRSSSSWRCAAPPLVGSPTQLGRHDPRPERGAPHVSCVGLAGHGSCFHPVRRAHSRRVRTGISRLERTMDIDRNQLSNKEAVSAHRGTEGQGGRGCTARSGFYPGRNILSPEPAQRLRGCETHVREQHVHRDQRHPLSPGVQLPSERFARARGAHFTHCAGVVDSIRRC